MKYTKRALNLGTLVETKEHPTFSKPEARRIARQHLSKHPMYYDLEPVFEQMLKAREKKKKTSRK
jgi:hypothetical protein